MRQKIPNFSADCREHYLSVLEDSLYCFPHLTSVNLGTLATNAICKALAVTCAGNLRELRICGPCKVSDLGLRYIAGLVPTIGQMVRAGSSVSKVAGCWNLEVLSLLDVEKISLHTITLLLLNLPELQVLDHNHLHEALWLLHKTGTTPDILPLKISGYNGRGTNQCQ